MLWKRKISEDFNFFGQGTARTSGWKFIYRGLLEPRGEQDMPYNVAWIKTLISLSFCLGVNQ